MALDALDLCIFVLAQRGHSVLLRNTCAQTVFGDGPLPESILAAIDSHALAEKVGGRPAPAVPVGLDCGNFFVRTVRNSGNSAVLIAVVRREIIRDADLFRHLNARHSVSRREYQVICGLRQGKTNRDISQDIGIAEATVARHVHRLLRRFDVPNRTRLVQMIEQGAVRGA